MEDLSKSKVNLTKNLFIFFLIISQMLLNNSKTAVVFNEKRLVEKIIFRNEL